MSLKNSSKISSFLFLIALLFVLALGSCAKTELDSFSTVDQNKSLSSKEDVFSDRSDDSDDDFVTDDEDDDEEEEDDKR